MAISPRWLLAGTLLLGLTSFGSGRGTLAFFTSTVSSAGNHFTAGSIKLQLNGSSPPGAITFDTATTSLIPGVTKYGYFTVDNLNSDAVTALFNNGSNGTVTITRTASTTAPSTTTNAAALDTRLNITLKDVTANATPITTSALCNSHWADASNVALTEPANLTSVTSTANRTALTSGSASTLTTSTISLASGATNKYCIQFQWVNDTNGSLDNAAMSGSNSYVVTFTGASS